MVIAVNSVDEKQFLNEVIQALRERGFEPWDQIKGYVELEDDSYITRRNGARNKIKQVSMELLKDELWKRSLYEKD